MLNLILFGPPGSGKGTQASNLVERYDLVHISTGDLFRYEIGNNTPLGQEAKAYMDKGELVPDEVTIGMLSNKMDSVGEVKGFILDGFPRTIAQAEALDSFLVSKGQTVDMLISIEVSEDELVRRLLERGKTSGRADDQDEKTIRNRFAVYSNETSPVAKYYDTKGKKAVIDGIGEIGEISRRLFQVIDPVAERV